MGAAVWKLGDSVKIPWYMLVVVVHYPELLVTSTVACYSMAALWRPDERRGAAEPFLRAFLWLSPVAVFPLVAYALVEGHGRALERMFTLLVVVPLACMAVVVVLRLRGWLTRRDTWLWFALITPFDGLYLAPSGNPGMAALFCLAPMSFFMLLRYFDREGAVRKKG